VHPNEVVSCCAQAGLRIGRGVNRVGKEAVTPLGQNRRPPLGPPLFSPATGERASRSEERPRVATAGASSPSGTCRNKVRDVARREEQGLTAGTRALVEAQIDPTDEQQTLPLWQ
jgi:hypothetical protein